MKLAGWIADTIKENCKGESFFDVFAGTSVVSAQIGASMKRLILNDFLQANYVIYNAFYEKEHFSMEKLSNYKTFFQNIDVRDQNKGYFSENYGGKYFSKNDAFKIEMIRNLIEEEKHNLNKKEYNILLASLIYSTDRSANTVGHYDAYFSKEPKNDKFIFDLIEPLRLKDTQVEIHKEDANALVSKIKADIAYIDPPYNSRQYSRFYHIYETIVKWNQPKLYGKALKPTAENMSEYCRNKAPDVFADLILKLQCKYFVVSYNNTYNSKSHSSRNKITIEEIKNILSKYAEIKCFAKNHSYFNAGKTAFCNHKEYLFVGKAK
ncbi:MAG: DNA adenine methylase [Helicobacteraceae bacterium]|jgi:adenine-specific DNA-methyltransferase|nr:DNA adenine methylase [Helicobacteraceae bacterium]